MAPLGYWNYLRVKKGFWNFNLPPQGGVQIVVTEAVAKRCSVKRVFLEISQNSQETFQFF